MKTTGVGFNEYLRNLRLENTRIILENGGISVKEAAASSGFNDALYFWRVFKKKYGIFPAKYPKLLKNKIIDSLEKMYVIILFQNIVS